MPLGIWVRGRFSVNPGSLNTVMDSIFEQLDEDIYNTCGNLRLRLPIEPDVVAPDGSDVRNLLDLQGGGMAHFELPAGQISNAEFHKTIYEIWFFLSGQGQMWRKSADHEEVVAVVPRVCLTILVGTHFQWRSTDDEPLAAIGVTMPPWPGEHESQIVAGKWTPTVP